eukprot:7726347-Ditylum_brightwellii.AAC.1
MGGPGSGARTQLAIAMKNRTEGEIIRAYNVLHAHFTDRGLIPKFQVLDNKASAAVQVNLKKNKEVNFQLALPHCHHCNAAERAIQTFKNHFVAELCSVHPNFPLQVWDKLLPQALLTLNLLCPSWINPRLSAKVQMNRAFDFNKTPLVPPGTRVIMHGKPK